MPAQYVLPAWIDALSEEYAIKLLLYQATGGIAPGSGNPPVVPPAVTAGPAQAAVGNGSVPAGKRAISFVTSSDWVGTINGAAFPASAAKSYEAPVGTSLPAIAYTRSAGTLYIDFLT